MNSTRDINQKLGLSLSDQRAENRRRNSSRIAGVIAMAVFIGAFAIVLM